MSHPRAEDLETNGLLAVDWFATRNGRGATLTGSPLRQRAPAHRRRPLHVSRPYLVKLLDDGTIDHYKVGTHRRVRIDDVLAYRERRAGTRGEKLNELTRLSEELPGGYR